jgi:membrane protein DedA with SNARE-associated domain
MAGARTEVPVLGIDEWLHSLPAMLVYAVVGGIIMLESMGIPLPGEVTLISASLMSITGALNPWSVAITASLGAIVGDSIGYTIGRRGGRPLLERVGRRFPKHFGPDHLARAERIFDKWGVWAVFYGRFVALLRILAGPLAGALHVPYRKFLMANATGGVVWAFGTTFVIYSVGQAAEKWLHDFAYLALIIAVLFGIGTTLFLRQRAAKAKVLLDDDDPTTNPTPPDALVEVAVGAAGAILAGVTHPAPPRRPVRTVKVRSPRRRR